MQLVTKITKKAAAQSGALSEDQLAAVEAAANAVENQAAADPNTNWKERAKMGGTYTHISTHISIHTKVMHSVY